MKTTSSEDAAKTDDDHPEASCETSASLGDTFEEEETLASRIVSLGCLGTSPFHKFVSLPPCASVCHIMGEGTFRPTAEAFGILQIQHNLS